MRRQVESRRQTQITDRQAKLIFYSAFVEEKLDAPKGLLADVIHRMYFEPEHSEICRGDHVELVERRHQRLQKVGTYSTIQGNGQVRRVP
jgi:hypothetical protein